MNIILFGQKNSGKTFLGKKLAEYLKYDFIDTDKEIEKRFFLLKKKSFSYKEIFKKEGEDFFRFLEKEVILDLNLKKDNVIALGAGAILDLEIRDFLKGYFFYLKISLEIFLKRLSLERISSEKEYFNDEKFRDIYKKRCLFYEKIPSYIINTDNLSFREFLCQIPLEKFLK